MGLSKKGFLKITLFTLLFLGLMIAWLGFGERGFIHLYRMEKERQAQKTRQLRLVAGDAGGLLPHLDCAAHS